MMAVNKEPGNIPEKESAERPIFIAGLSYSGKTQLRMMLENHSRLSLTRRTFFWKKYDRQFGDLGTPENFERCLASIASDRHVQAIQPDLDKIRTEFADGPSTYGRLFSIIHAQHAASGGKARWGIQSGLVEHFARRIFEELPEARIIHMIRDPRQRISEILDALPTRPWKLGWETGHWIHSARIALANSKMFPSRYLLVHWEALRARTENTLRDVCSFLEEPYEISMLDPLSDEADPALSRPRSLFIEKAASNEMAAFDYQPGNSSGSLAEWFQLLLLVIPPNLAGMMLWRFLGTGRLPKSGSHFSQTKVTSLEMAK